MNRVNEVIIEALKTHLGKIGKLTQSDALLIHGPMAFELDKIVRNRVENMAAQPEFNKKLTILLETQGGLIDTVERMVTVIRHHYEQVDFIIPNMAMSAGTVFSLSGDNIYMDYFSVLGPIDPQFEEDGKWVPGLGYLEKFNELNKKSEKGTLTPLEVHLAEGLNLAKLHMYEQAREHSVELLEKWLTQYKFKDWNKSQKEKKSKAKEIGEKLNQTTRWHTHGRGISKDVLIKEIGLKIEDFEKNKDLTHAINTVQGFVLDLESGIIISVPFSSGRE